MKKFSFTSLYLPAFTIIGVVILLLMFIGVSTFRNLDRERRATLKMMEGRGRILMEAIEAGIRSDLVASFGKTDAFRTLLSELTRNGDIAYIYLVDASGEVVHHSIPSLKGLRMDREEIREGLPAGTHRIRRTESGERIFEMAGPFEPFKTLESYRLKAFAARNPDFDVHLHEKSVLVVGLGMEAFDEARRSDIHHALIMAAIVVALGAGVFFFLFVIQNYYVSEKALRRTRDYARFLVENMAGGLVSIDRNHLINVVNKNASELLGKTRSEMLDTPIESVIPADRIDVRPTVLHGLPVLNREVTLDGSGGRCLSISVTPLITGDRIEGAVLLLNDRTEMKRLEQKVRNAEKLAAIGELAAAVAHEIRNPLSSIRGFAGYLRHFLGAETRAGAYADVMVREVDRINGVVSGLLSISRPDAPDLRPVSVTALVDHVTTLVSAEAAGKQVRITYRDAPELGRPSLDESKVTQALLNLLLNAVAAVDEGGGIVITAEKDPLTREMSLSVEDDGPGIPAAIRDRVTEPFFTTRKSGTGMGLAIVRKVAELHGGELTVESPAPGTGRGCRMTLRFPEAFGQGDGPAENSEGADRDDRIEE